LTIYDPTCGGGNLLFGVEDKIQEVFPNRPTATFGQEWNDTLYALAKIESRFRRDTQIEYGNTLTEVGKFYDKSFNISVANPPYGVDWKGFEKEIKNDTTGRFVSLPSISDGQFLFTQHILHKLATDGFAVVVHNGSTLFSGDAGSGESNIRKYFFEKDWVEAIVQMPTDEFFNTGIYTYLWIFNKNKSEACKDKVILINASELSVPLKKSKGKKRKEMDATNRALIVQAFEAFEDNDFCKVFDKWYFYYNKQSILLTNVDENGLALETPLKLKPTRIVQTDEDGNTVELTEFDITTFPTDTYTSLEDYFEQYTKPLVASLDYKEKQLRVETDKNTSYWYDAEAETLICQTGDTQTTLGCGKIVVKAALKKDSKTKLPKSIGISVELTRDVQKDYEIIPYSPNEAENQQLIADFMAQYITKPFEYVDNVVGVEINFNKVFYTPEKLRAVSEIMDELKELDDELNKLESALVL
jgi:type I restriction enzyme M protein